MRVCVYAQLAACCSFAQMLQCPSCTNQASVLALLVEASLGFSALLVLGVYLDLISLPMGPELAACWLPYVLTANQETSSTAESTLLLWELLVKRLWHLGWKPFEPCVHSEHWWLYVRDSLPFPSDLHCTQLAPLIWVPGAPGPITQPFPTIHTSILDNITRKS